MLFSVLLFFFCFFLILFYNVFYMFILLFLEGVLLSVFMLFVFFYFGVQGLFGCFVYLLLIVCMGGFSISLLVSLSRVFGRDFWCLRFVF